MDEYKKKICFYFSTFTSPPGEGLAGSSSYHQEAPEQTKSTTQIPVENKKGTAESKKRGKLDDE